MSEQVSRRLDKLSRWNPANLGGVMYASGIRAPIVLFIMVILYGLCLTRPAVTPCVTKVMGHGCHLK